MGEEPTPQPKPENGEKAEKAPSESPDIYKVKVDHFEGIHCLEEDKVLEGAPNFRQVTGFPIFGCAQPTLEGFVKVLDKIPKGTGDKVVRTVWYNMRQEPVIYCDGIPCAPRHPDR